MEQSQPDLLLLLSILIAMCGFFLAKTYNLIQKAVEDISAIRANQILQKERSNNMEKRLDNIEQDIKELKLKKPSHA